SNESGTIYALTYDGTNYSEAATSSITKIDITSPSLELGDTIAKTGSIEVLLTMSDTGSGLGTPTCKYGTSASSYDKNATSVDTSSCVITGLTTETTYYYQICVSDKVGNTSTCKTGQATTEKITKPGIELVNTPTTLKNGYLQKQVAKVTYTSSNISSPQYYVKTTKQGTSSRSVTSSCGSDTKPGTCTTISSTTTLKADTWYKVSGNVNVTYNTTSTETGTIYALTYDGTNYSESSTGSIAKIDATSPTLTTGTHTVSKYSITLNYTASDSHSQIDKVVCKYGTSTSYDKEATGSSTSCTLSNLNSYTTYYYEYTAYDKVGNTKSFTGSRTTLFTPTSSCASQNCSSIYITFPISCSQISSATVCYCSGGYPSGCCTNPAWGGYSLTQSSGTSSSCTYSYSSNVRYSCVNGSCPFISYTIKTTDGTTHSSD
ncbi:MAG: hypothetical protein NC181_02485, partial [Clostridium sp.]|nr:hypothetical protein [Clostridium sp.]